MVDDTLPNELHKVDCTYILFDVAADLLWEVEPPLLVLHLDGVVFGIQSILELETSLHASHWAVAAMFQDVAERFQQRRLRKFHNNECTQPSYFNLHTQH